MKAKEITINYDNLNKEGLLKVLKKELGFPDFFGMNWDALIDCVSYMRQPEAGLSEVFLQANFETDEFLDVVQFINERELSSCGNSQVLLNLIP